MNDFTDIFGKWNHDLKVQKKAALDGTAFEAKVFYKFLIHFKNFKLGATVLTVLFF